MMRLFNIKSRLSCLLLIGMMCCTCFFSACKDENVIEIDGSSALKPNTSIESINTNVKALRRLIEAKQLELDVKSYNPVKGINASGTFYISFLNLPRHRIYSPQQIQLLKDGIAYKTIDLPNLCLEA